MTDMSGFPRPNPALDMPLAQLTEPVELTPKAKRTLQLDTPCWPLRVGNGLMLVSTATNGAFVVVHCADDVPESAFSIDVIVPDDISERSFPERTHVYSVEPYEAMPPGPDRHPGWTATVDGVPDEDGKFLVFAPRAVRGRDVITTAWWNGANRTWDLIPLDMHTAAVTQWIPLPETS
jgi:hypothetical protein